MLSFDLYVFMLVLYHLFPVNTSLSGPSSITCKNSMDVSYIPIAKAKGFTTHLINIYLFKINTETSFCAPAQSPSPASLSPPDTPTLCPTNLSVFSPKKQT